LLLQAVLQFLDLLILGVGGMVVLILVEK
jgi:hypothetical protein